MAPKYKPKNPELNISPRAVQFVNEMLANPTITATSAAIRAGYARKSAHVTACQLMNDKRVTDLLAAKKKEVIEALALKTEDVLRDLFHVVTADPRDLSEYRVGCCRYCYGEGHQYQRTPREYKIAWKAYLASDEGRADPLGLKFDHEGGLGYDRRKEPHPDCPECFGEGEGRTVIKDTRSLNPAARAFYNGVKETKHGVEVQTRSKDRAIDLAARHLGVVKGSSGEPPGRGGPGGGPAPIAAVVLTTTDPLEAARQYQQLMGG